MRTTNCRSTLALKFSILSCLIAMFSPVYAGTLLLSNPMTALISGRIKAV